jgi:hypothetical protein
VRVELSVDSDTNNIVGGWFYLFTVKIVVYLVVVNAVTC